MNLMIIYGPPAAGKLTVANEIAKRTEFKVFHNHLSIDCVKPVFEFGTPAFWRVVGDIRDVVITTAVREDVSLIHTFCYEFGVDDKYFRKLIAAAEDNGGEVHLILLVCDDDERKRRIGNESRVKIGKLIDPASFDREHKPELSTPWPGRDTLIIDTTDTQPERAAEKIVQHFGL